MSLSNNDRNNIKAEVEKKLRNRSNKDKTPELARVTNRLFGMGFLIFGAFFFGGSVIGGFFAGEYQNDTKTYFARFFLYLGLILGGWGISRLNSRKAQKSNGHDRWLWTYGRFNYSFLFFGSSFAAIGLFLFDPPGVGADTIQLLAGFIAISSLSSISILLIVWANPKHFLSKFLEYLFDGAIVLLISSILAYVLQSTLYRFVLQESSLLFAALTVLILGSIFYQRRLRSLSEPLAPLQYFVIQFISPNKIFEALKTYDEIVRENQDYLNLKAEVISELARLTFEEQQIYLEELRRLSPQKNRLSSILYSLLSSIVLIVLTLIAEEFVGYPLVESICNLQFLDLTFASICQ